MIPYLLSKISRGILWNENIHVAINIDIHVFLHLPSMIPSISYRHLWLIHSSIETDRTEIYMLRLSIG